jgi:hypothetical protein
VTIRRPPPVQTDGYERARRYTVVGIVKIGQLTATERTDIVFGESYAATDCFVSVEFKSVAPSARHRENGQLADLLSAGLSSSDIWHLGSHCSTE